MTTTYYVKVIGYLWSGPKSIYSKTFTDLPTGNIQPHFGDFESILDHQLVRITVEHKDEVRKYITIKTEEIVKDWDCVENREFYEQIVD